MGRTYRSKLPSCYDWCFIAKKGPFNYFLVKSTPVDGDLSRAALGHTDKVRFQHTPLNRRFWFKFTARWHASMRGWIITDMISEIGYVHFGRRRPI